MGKILITIFTTASIGIILNSNANANSAIQPLLKCDSTFFKEVKNINGLQAITSKLDNTVIEKQREISIPLNYTSPEGIKINKFTMSYSSFDDLKKRGIKGIQGKYYYWGFESPQSVKQITKLLSQNNQLIQNGDVYIYNPMIRFGKNSKWQSTPSASSGTAPSAEVTEKVLIIEKKSKGTSINCSLQGSVSDKDLIAAGLHKK